MTTSSREKIYVLECKEGKYYIGKSRDVESRVQQHFNGSGSSFTFRYRPLRLIESREMRSPLDEDQTVKEYMFNYGMNNVRGGSYSQLELTSAQEELLGREFDTATDRCYRCGHYNHLAPNCPLRSARQECFRCGRVGHWINNCYASTDINGNELEDDENDWDSDGSEEDYY